MSNKTVAFALGGLAGNNFHGAGFLHAALAAGVKPKLISCTSGQIRWAHKYLAAQGSAEHFQQQYLEDLARSRPTNEPNLDLTRLMSGGFPGVFRPAWEHWLPDITRNGLAAATHSLAGLRDGKVPLLADNLLAWTTSRVSVPLFKKRDLEAACELFNSPAHGIGIAFNSYDPREGVEHVYLNDAAFEATRKEAESCRQEDRKRSGLRPYRVYRRITPAGLEAALWLYAYGFDTPRVTAQDEDGAGGSTRTHLDGAFFREVMLAEVMSADLVFAVRPINHRWLDKALPTTYPGTEDLKTEVSFNGSYSAERDQLRLINKLLAENIIDPHSPQGQHYHPIDLEEIEIQKPRGYFDYALESNEVFVSADQAARARFKKLGLA